MAISKLNLKINSRSLFQKAAKKESISSFITKHIYNIQAVSFQREDNIKHEVELNLATDIIEDLSIEHYQR